MTWVGAPSNLVECVSATRIVLGIMHDPDAAFAEHKDVVDEGCDDGDDVGDETRSPEIRIKPVCVENVDEGNQSYDWHERVEFHPERRMRGGAIPPAGKRSCAHACVSKDDAGTRQHQQHVNAQKTHHDG